MVERANRTKSISTMHVHNADSSTQVELVRLSMQQQDALTVLLTGRAEKGFGDLIQKMAKSRQLEFDLIVLKPKSGPSNEKLGSTMKYKQAFLEYMIKTYHVADEIRIYEDRVKQYGSRLVVEEDTANADVCAASKTSAISLPSSTQVYNPAHAPSLTAPARSPSKAKSSKSSQTKRPSTPSKNAPKSNAWSPITTKPSATTAPKITEYGAYNAPSTTPATRSNPPTLLAYWLPQNFPRLLYPTAASAHSPTTSSSHHDPLPKTSSRKPAAWAQSFAGASLPSARWVRGWIRSGQRA